MISFVERSGSSLTNYSSVCVVLGAQVGDEVSYIVPDVFLFTNFTHRTSILHIITPTYKPHDAPIISSFDHQSNIFTTVLCRIRKLEIRGILVRNNISDYSVYIEMKRLFEISLAERQNRIHIVNQNTFISIHD